MNEFGYKRRKPPVGIKFMVNEEKKPLVYLEDSYGGKSIIYDDDGCFVLANKSVEYEDVIYFNRVYHWFPEAVIALQDYLTSLYSKYKYHESRNRWETYIEGHNE